MVERIIWHPRENERGANRTRALIDDEGSDAEDGIQDVDRDFL